MDFHISLIQNVVEEIEANLCEPIKISKIAATSGLSQWQFQRVFRAYIGDSLGNYLRHRRLTQSVDFLINTDRRILDIALDFQFSSQEAYTRSFKDYFDKTPKQMRTEKPQIILQKKPVLSQKMIEHLYSGLELKAQIIDAAKRKLVGFEQSMPSFVDQYHDFNHMLLPIWWKLFEAKKNIKHMRLGAAIGLAQSNSLNNNDSEFRYIAAYEVEEFIDVPENMCTYVIPPQKYAVFTGKGTGDKSSYTINYIYGIWLSQSKYQRAEGDDFQLFDTRYKVMQADSESDYYLPIKETS